MSKAEGTLIQTISDLIVCKGSDGKQLFENNYSWVKEAILHLREAYEKGETMNGQAATLCQKSHYNYKRANEMFGWK